LTQAGQARAEAEAKLTQADSARAAAEAKLAQVEASLKAEQEARKGLEQKLAGAAAAPAAQAAPSDWEAERDSLKADVANLKRKLMTAETALETAAGYKAKIARLEAQLKGKK
ncbi:plectin 1 isoform 8, partial [Pyxidicoccus sp. 3LG]